MSHSLLERVRRAANPVSSERATWRAEDLESAIVDHLEHIVKTGGEDCASLGSDWDGAIITPRDMPTCLELPRLVQLMLDRQWTATRIGKILGGNWLATLERLRPSLGAV